jgi:hypothetical protein
MRMTPARDCLRYGMDPRLGLTGAVGEQRHEHRVSEGLVGLVDVEGAGVGDAGGGFLLIVLSCAGEPVTGGEVGPVGLG